MPKKSGLSQSRESVQRCLPPCPQSAQWQSSFDASRLSHHLQSISNRKTTLESSLPPKRDLAYKLRYPLLQPHD